MAEAAQYKLIVHEESGTRELELGPNPAVVGRSSENTVQIQHGSISRRHCEIRFSPEGVELRDLNSSNGTRVNGERISRQGVKPGDEIHFGQIRAELHALGAETPAGPAVAADIELDEISIEDPPATAADAAALASDQALASDYIMVVVDGEGAGERHALARRRLTVGRSGSCDVRVKGLGVSGTHAEIVWEGDRPTLRDLDSTNGIHLSGRRVKQVALADGQLIGIGKVSVRVEGPGEEIDIGGDLDLDIGSAAESADDTLQFRDLTRADVPRRRMLGAVVGLTLLLVALGAAAVFYFMPASSKRIGQRLGGTVETPAGSLITRGFSAEEADIAGLWPLDDPSTGELSRSAAAKRQGRFGFVLERSASAPVGRPTTAFFADTIPVDGHRRYSLTVFARREKGDVRAGLVLRFLDAAGQVVQEIYSPLTSADAFEAIEVSPTVPEGCGSATVGLMLTGGAGVAHFDDIALRPSELTPRSGVVALNRFTLQVAPHGSWSLRADTHWPLRRAEYFLAAGKARVYQELAARPEGEGLNIGDEGARFSGTLRGPTGKSAEFGFQVRGKDAVTFAYQPWKGEGAEREGLRFYLQLSTLKDGVLVSSGGDVGAQTGEFTVEACDAMLLGKGGRRVRLVMDPPLDVDVALLEKSVCIELSRRHDPETPFQFIINTSLVDLIAGAKSEMDRGTEAVARERYGDAYRHLNRLLREFAVDASQVDRARALIAQVQARFQERFQRLKQRADEASHFKDEAAVARLLAEAEDLQKTYANTPVEDNAATIVKKLRAVHAGLVEARISTIAGRYLLLARDARDRGDVAFAEEYYRVVMDRCRDTPFAKEAETELTEMRRVSTEVNEKPGDKPAEKKN